MEKGLEAGLWSYPGDNNDPHSKEETEWAVLTSAQSHGSTGFAQNTYLCFIRGSIAEFSHYSITMETPPSFDGNKGHIGNHVSTLLSLLVGCLTSTTTVSNQESFYFESWWKKSWGSGFPPQQATSNWYITLLTETLSEEVCCSRRFKWDTDFTYLNIHGHQLFVLPRTRKISTWARKDNQQPFKTKWSRELSGKVFTAAMMFQWQSTIPSK